MLNFNYLLENLMNCNCNPLYTYNQYVLKRFFEYAINDETYVNSVLNGNTGLYKIKGYCPNHEKVLITACITSLSKSKNKNIYKQYYKDYLTIKTSFMGWRGRTDWFDFHKTVLSHFIWENDKETFNWTWSKITEYMKDFKKKYPAISDWRRRWYLQEITKLRLYIINVCITSDKINFVQWLFKKNIVKNTKSVENLLIKFGYLFSESNLKISKAKFTHTPEWKWLIHKNDNIDKLNSQKIIEVCMISNFDKKRLITLFETRDAPFFWDYFLKSNERQITFLTCKKLCQLLSSPKYKIDFKNIKLKYNVVMKIFELHKILTPSILKVLSNCTDKFNINVNEGSIIVISLILQNTELNEEKLSNMKQICDLFISNGCIKPTPTFRWDKFLDKISTDQLYWLYSLLGNRVDPIIDFSIIKRKVTISHSDTCPICLNSLNSKTNCTFPCGHSFHNHCIHNHIKSRENSLHGINSLHGNSTHGIDNCSIYKCPMCRSKVNMNWINSVVT